MIFMAVSAVIYYVKTTAKSVKIAQPVEIKITDGTFFGATGKELKIKIIMPSDDNTEAASSTIEKEVNYQIDGRTKFYRYGEQAKTTDKYNKEFAEFSRKIKQLVAEGKNVVGLEPPAFFNLEAVSSQDYQIGEQLSLYTNRDDANDPRAVLTKVVADKAKDAKAGSIKNPPYQENLEGNIQAISGNKLSILVDPADPLTASSSKPALREFVLDGSVKLSTSQQKKQEQYLKEQLEFNDKLNQLIKASKPIIGLEPPSPEIKEAVDISGLKPGQKVKITTEVDGIEITVLEIIVLVK